MIQIDQKTFEGLCKIQCTKREVASVMNCSDDTIERWCGKTYNETFAVASKRLGEGGKASLRRMLWKHAERSASACIFLAKNILGYKDIGKDEDGSENEACNNLANALMKLAEVKGGRSDNTNGQTASSN